ncbi:MmcQ/YjbR family DNA-binding protein [Amycolatopsis samaneae]|uniref:MmcQ/YjbR family DNA-binding protein n=1 Tax=Amycolatopsis samaneae TaxID=664691 RepID=A0ABW5GDM7_9PSEU
MTTWEEVVRMASELPEVTESTSYRTPALKVAGKTFGRLRTEAEGGLMLVCGLDEKAALLGSGDPAFFTTPHYDGYGSILVDLERADAAQLRELVEDAWLLKAPPKVRKLRDGAT